MNTIKRLQRIRESLKETYLLSSDQNDALEGIVLNNRNKTDKEILSILLNDNFFSDISEEDLLKAIQDTKRIYKV